MLAMPGVSIAQPSTAANRTPAFAIELEGGPAWQRYNDVEIPNDGPATRFSLSDLVGTGPWAAGRVYVTWNVRERHGLRLLLAPFSLTESGVPGQALDFAGSNFAAQELVEATYTFNSYRLSYRYRFRTAPRTSDWWGAPPRCGTRRSRSGREPRADGRTTSGLCRCCTLLVSGSLRRAGPWGSRRTASRVDPGEPWMRR